MPSVRRFTTPESVPSEPGTGVVTVRIAEKLQLVAEARGIELRLPDLRTRLSEIQEQTFPGVQGSRDRWTSRLPRPTP